MMIFPLMISLVLIAMTESEYTDIYNFPMLGILMYDTLKVGEYDLIAYGSVTMLHQRVVLCGVENLVQTDPDNKRFIFDDASVYNLQIYAGSDIIQPPRHYEVGKTQNVKVKSIHMAKNSSFVSAIDKNTNWDELKKSYNNLVLNRFSGKQPNLYKFPEDVVFNAFVELQWDIAILVLEGSGFRRTPYILPIPFHWKDNKQLTRQSRDFWDKIAAAEKQQHKYIPCSVPGWSPIGYNEVIYHRVVVVYARFKDCAEAICGAYPSTCLKYLNARQRICFKSLGFADSCVLDQEAPVVCPWTSNSKNPDVLGILVKTFECGTEGLPLVFTRTYTIAAFAKIAMNEDEDFDVEEPALSDPDYTERPIE